MKNYSQFLCVLFIILFSLKIINVQHYYMVKMNDRIINPRWEYYSENTLCSIVISKNLLEFPKLDLLAV